MKNNDAGKEKGKKMKKIAEKNWRRIGAGGAMVVALGLVTVLPQTGVTTTPVELGVAQPPLITIIFDTSASMQWGGFEEGSFPYLDYDPATMSAVEQHRFRETWENRMRLNLAGSANRDSSGRLRMVTESEAINNHVQAVGPCMVWHPSSSSGDRHYCEDYRRPPSCAEEDQCGDEVRYDEIFAEPGPENALARMRQNPAFRLTEETGIPRHIQVKQILTGDFHLTVNGDVTTAPGPGCWVVPRGRGGQGEQVCCESVELRDVTVNGVTRQVESCTGDGSDQFLSFLDSSDPVPHYQEVWDVQVNNGLLDAMASTAIFSAVMFDSYRYEGTGLGWNFPTTDIVAGNSPYTSADFLSGSGAQGVEGALGACNDADCYDMGIFRFIGPTRLDVDEIEMRAISSYVQEAILNTGFIFHEIENLNRTRDVIAEDGSTTTAEVTAPVFTYPLGKQIIGQATPYGGVFHDLHQFYLHGQYEVNNENFVDNPDEELVPGNIRNPFADDPYRACRARHVVLFTDADEVLEVPGGAGNNLGVENLSEPFGYIQNRYPYLVSEDAIRRMMDAVIQQMEQGTTGAIDTRFYPRLHVLAVSDEDEIDDPVLWDRMLDKVGAMARAGRTCAQYYLPPSRVPVGIPTGTRDENGIYMTGTCNPAEDVCLVEQNYGPFDFEAPGDDQIFSCSHPALMFTRNDRESLVEAFQLIFNEVARASGVSSRTRPSVTNYIDDGGNQGQYRLFSGLQIGGSTYWKGLLTRQFLDCENLDDPDAAPVVHRMHEDMNLLRYPLGGAAPDSPEPVPGDRRRVFTSLSSLIADADSIDSTGPLGVYYALLSAASSAEDDFGAYDIAVTGGSDEVFTRIPFEQQSLLQAFGGGIIDDPTKDNFFTYWGVVDTSGSETREERFDRIINRYRARSAARHDRVLGGIYNSNPVTVGPPDLDLPIDSYREFRQLYRNRPTMTYVSSIDGQLHAIYTGNPEVLARTYAADGVASDGGKVKAEHQREAWAYVPALLHRRLVENFLAPFPLLDASPVVRDIRLCHGSPDLNTNPRVCQATGDAVPPIAQWRTVLIQGLGEYPGYFALDVTRPGGSSTELGGDGEPDRPDPIVLWEFGPEWEQLQLERMTDTSLFKDGDLGSGPCNESLDPSPWKMSFMGMSNAEPAMGTVAVGLGALTPMPRAVAIFGGGEPGEVEALNEECTADIIGKAIYVVDLQSGALIRRFTASDEGRFEHAITGTPVLSASQPGQISSRAFIGDSAGQLLRIDMSSPDPSDWEVSIFFDPADELDPEAFQKERFGPASFRPAITTTPSRELVVIYGLGQRGESGGSDLLQAMIALKEVRNDEDTEAEVLWSLPLIGVGDTFLAASERLTGAPVIFDSDVFFTTYLEPESQCEAGFSRIYRLRYDGIDPSTGEDGEPVGRWTNLGTDPAGFRVENPGSGDPKWFGPSDPAMIRGLSVTLGPVCSDEIVDTEGRGTATEGQRRAPQLVAAAGTANVGTGPSDSPASGTASPAGGDISRLAVDLELPQTRSIPLSWSVIGN